MSLLQPISTTANLGAACPALRDDRYVVPLPPVSLGAGSMIVHYCRAPDLGPRAYSDVIAAGRCKLTVALRHGRTRVHRNGDLLHDGLVLPGMARLAHAGDRIEGQLFSALEAVSIDLPAERLARRCPSTDRPIRPVLHADSRTEQLGRMLVDVAQQDGQQVGLFGQGVVDAILAVLLDHDQRDPAEPCSGAAFSPKELQRVLDVADARGGVSLALTDWAAAIGLSVQEFTRRFRLTTGSSPYAFFLRRRIERAKDLMLQTDLPLVEIALETGFCSQSHFTGAFRRRMGVSPGQWRRRR